MGDDDEDYLRKVAGQLGGIESTLKSMQSQLNSGRDDRKAFRGQLTKMSGEMTEIRNAFERRLDAVEGRADKTDQALQDEIRPAIQDMKKARNRGLLILGGMTGTAGAGGAYLPDALAWLRKLLS